MKLIKESTKILKEEGKILNLRRNGFVIAPEENFSDDGNYFKGYYYDPDKTGDKRFITSKLVSDGDAYISVKYYNPETGKTTYFDKLNGVPYERAINGIKDLTDEIDAFKKKLDSGEIKTKVLSDDEYQQIKDKVKQLNDLTGEGYYSAFEKILKKFGIDEYDLSSAQRAQIKKEIESEIRNTREDNPVLIKVLAKAVLDNVMKLMKSEFKYDSRGRSTSRDAKSLEDALNDYVSVNTYGWGKESKELLDAGLEKDTSYSLSKLTDANQEKIKNWVRNKVETLYDFE